MISLLGIAIASRAIVWFSLGCFHFLRTNGLPGFHFVFVEVWKKWDGAWYLGIVGNGYQIGERLALGESNFAFFPAYPLSARYLAALTGMQPDTAAALLSNFCFAAALVFLGLCARKLGLSRRASFGAALLCAFAPHSFVFSAIYTESFFLLFSLAFFWAWLDRRYLFAGLFGIIVCATRPNGFFITLIPLLDWIVQNFERSPSFIKEMFLCWWNDPRQLLPFILPFAGIFGYWTFCHLQTGDAFAQISTLEHGWKSHRDFPFRPAFLYLNTPKAAFWFWSAFFFFTVSLFLWFLRWWGLAAYATLSFLLFFSSSIPASLLRYSITVFPLYFVLGKLWEKSPITGALILAFSSMINAVLIFAWYTGHHVAI